MATEQPDSTPIGEQASDPQSGDVETIPNKKRGCGHLEEGKTYLRADLSEDGTLPAFVELEEPVAYHEGHFRNWQYFPGISFEVALSADGIDTNPPGEVWNMLDRLATHGTTGRHFGEMRAAHAHDVLDWVGVSYYPTPEDFIHECETQGMNRAIGASSRQQPPVVNPGFTRVWFVHPNAIPVDRDDEPDEWTDFSDRDTHRPGIIGYSYVTRVVYTGMRDGDGSLSFPQWAQDYAAQGRMELVEAGPPQPAPHEADDNGGVGVDTQIEDWAATDDDTTTDDAEEEATTTESGGRPIDELGFHDLRRLAGSEDVNAGRNPTADDLRDALQEAGITHGDIDDNGD